MFMLHLQVREAMVSMYVRKMNENRIGIDSSVFRTTAEANSSAFRTVESGSNAFNTTNVDRSAIRTTEEEYQKSSPIMIREDSHRNVHVHVHVHQKFELQVIESMLTMLD